MRFRIYKVTGPGKATILGQVNAVTFPSALLRAYKKWPKETDPKQVQGGFYAVKVARS